MEPFSAAFLTTLAGKLAGNVAASLTGPLKRQVAGTPAQQAVERSLRVALVALAAQATAAAPEQETLLRDIFDEFFHYPAVWVQIGNLLSGKPLDRAQRNERFVEAGYDSTVLPDFDFNAGLETFTMALAGAIAWEPALQDVLSIGRLNNLLETNSSLSQQLNALMVELQQNKDARVSKGYVIDDDANLYRWPPKRTLPVVGDIDSLNGNLIGNSDHGAGKQSKGLPHIFNLPDPLSSLALESSKNLLRLKLRHVDTTQLKDGIPFGYSAPQSQDHKTAKLRWIDQ